jgi:hypothetical protein
MKNIKSYILLSLGLLLLASCSDDYMTELNTDTSKVAEIDPNTQLTTAQLQTYGDLNVAETYRSYIYAFTQHLMGCWNTTNYGGQHRKSDSEMSRTWNAFYGTAIKNLVDAKGRTDGDVDKVNVNSAIRIYKVYIMSILTDIYGDVPYSEAGLGFLGEKFNPKYDTQEDIYTDFFKELTESIAAFDSSKESISGDVIFDGDLTKWKKFANSLRLRFAMRISDIKPEVAKQEFEAALAADGGVIESSADDALIKYMDASYSFADAVYSDYRGNRISQLFFGNDPIASPGGVLCSTFFNQLDGTNDPRQWIYAGVFYDGLIQGSGPADNRIDITKEILASSYDFVGTVRKPGEFCYEPWPTDYSSALVQAYVDSHPGFDAAAGNAQAYSVFPKLPNNFLRTSNPGVVITSAEVKFLLAEAALKGWSVQGSVEDLYSAGVRASMDFLADNYGTTPVSDADFEAFMEGSGKLGASNNARKGAINTQAWILHFTNPAEAWANVRRSGYPALLSPENYVSTDKIIDGKEIPLRLCYPQLEASYNKASYQEALDRMGGENSWNTPVWWDVNAAE